VVQAIDRLLDAHTDGAVATHLKARGARPGQNPTFTPRLVANFRHAYQLPSRSTRLRDAGLLTVDEVARRLDVSPATVKHWRRHGLLPAHRYDDHGRCRYEAPGSVPPVKWQRKFAPRTTATTPHQAAE
jgi:hypothetical protein